MKYLLYFFIISNYFVINAQNNNTQDYLGIKYLTLEDGLSQVTINDLIIDHSGFIWIATANGLNQFDGKEFKHFMYNESDTLSISGNFINKLLEDRFGNIWVGTNGNGLNCYDQYMDVFHRVKLKYSQNENEIISAIAKDKNGIIWVASRTSGLHRLQSIENESLSQDNYFSNQALSGLLVDENNNLWIGSFTGQVFRIELDKKQPLERKPVTTVSGNVQALYETKSHLLIGSDVGFYIYDLQNKSVQSFELETKGDFQTKHVVAFLEENDSEVWIGTGNGLYLFNWIDKTIIRKIEYSDYGADGLSNNTVQSLLRVSPYQMFVGTANSLNLIDFKAPYFRNISKDKKGNHLLNDNVIFSIFKDGGDLWVGTSDGGLNLIRDDKTYFFKTNQNDPATISGSVIRGIVKDEKNERLWLATSRGLSLIDLTTFDPNHPKFTVFRHNPDNPNSINMNFIKDIALDKNNNLWGATFGQGIFRLEIFNENKIKVIRYKNEKDNPNSIRNDVTQCIRVDKKNNVWIGTQGGLTQLTFKDSNYNNPDFTNYYKIANMENTLSHNSVYDVLIDKQERLWLGTRNGLNLFLGDNKFESWTEQNQFPNTIVYSIQDDFSENLWLGTSDGMVKFNPENSDFTHYSVKDNIQSKEFDIHARFRDTNGIIYMGGIEGVTYFHPNNLENIDNTVQLYFSQLRVKDKVAKPNKDSHNLLKQSISTTNNLTFKHNQFPFYLQFSSIDFRLHKNIEFAYRLLPSDTDWNILKDPEIQFLNLPPGKYKLQVNGFSRGKEWEQPPLELNLNILPPWWSTSIAYIIYIALVLFLGDRIYRFQLSRKIAASETRRLKEVSQLKNTLFTNITHEFRTPLTVIKGMTSSIKSNLENKQLDGLESSLEMIDRNSDGLLHLVNEMLDLAKIESGTMELQLVQTNIIPVVKYLIQSFHSLAEEKDINFSIYSEIDHLKMDFDTKKLTSIVSNLLSNAIKFTSKNDEILVHLDSIHENNTNFFVLEVKDSGLGIHKDELLHVFDKFYQVNNASSRNVGGTGIGLSLTKEFVELMNGSISVESSHGKGSIFKVKIPITNKAVQVDGSELISTSLVSTVNNLIPLSQTEQSSIEVPDEFPLVLIIEDNKDVAYYLKTCLQGKYQTVHAHNGSIGIEMAYENIPDIVICDVMMPEKDGFEVCESLKTNELTDHIPIIMLTAKATFKDRLTGLSHGADAYLTKPFEKAELLTRINQLILLRKKMLSKFEKTGIDRLLNKNVKNSETKFLNKIITVIHDNMTLTDFGSEQLAFELHLSESQLYRKLKAISGKSTAVFIRSIRLQKGKELIQTTDKTISEVAYDVGFNDPSWFSRAFKDEFGYAPSVIPK